MSSRKVVLIVDDDESILEMFSVAFSSKDFEVLQASNGKEALEWLKKRNAKVDIIILDIVMPVMDGFETLEKIKANNDYKNIPIIVASNLESDSDRQVAYASGANDFFEKAKYTPFDLIERANKILKK